MTSVYLRCKRESGFGIVFLDLQSSDEHWGTFFLTPQGVINQGAEKISKEHASYLKEVYIPYDYWYTATWSMIIM